jgi:hypothetical protein
MMRTSLTFEASLQGSLNLAVMLSKAGRNADAVRTLADVFSGLSFFTRARVPTDERPVNEAKKIAELSGNLLSSSALSKGPTAEFVREVKKLAALLRVALKERTGLLAVLRAMRDDATQPVPKLSSNSRELVVLRKYLEKAERLASALGAVDVSMQGAF